MAAPVRPPLFQVPLAADVQAVLDAAAGVLPIVVLGADPITIDIAPGAGQQYRMASGQRVRGEGRHTIRVINGDSTNVSGSGFYVDAASQNRDRVFLEHLNVEGENGSSWGHDFVFTWNNQSLVARFLANGSGVLRDFGVRFSSFRHLDGFPVQVVGVMDKAFGGWFDFNFCYEVSRALNCSAPYSSLSFNRFERAQIAEFAAAMMTVLGNIAKDHYGNFSIGASDLTSGSRYGNIIALNALDEQIQTDASAQVATTDGAEATLIALNVLRRGNSRAVLLGSAVNQYGAPRTRLLGNVILSPGNIVESITRIAIDVNQDFADVDLNTVFNEASDIATWATQTGLRIEGDDGAYERNRLDGVSNHVQFNGGKRNYWGPGNIYDPAKVAFASVPTDASQFLDGSFLRGRNISPGVTSLPTPAIGYRGLTHSTQSDSTGYGDSRHDIIRGNSGNYVAVATREPTARTVTNANLTATRHDRLVFFSTGVSDRTVTLPTGAALEGYQPTFKKIDAGAGKVLFSQAIDGNASFALDARYEYVKLYYDGSAYHVIGCNA